MAKRITINTIAERAGVSRGTVDRVLNGRPHVKPEIAERVLRTMRELGYAPPRAEQADALGLSRSAAELPPCRLGVLLTSESGYLRQELLRGVQDVKIIMPIAFLSYIVFNLPVGYLLGFTLGMGAQGLILGFTVGLTTAAVLLIVRYRRDIRRWKAGIR